MSSLSWARLQSLFDVALSLGPAEREDYLSRECGPDTALRLQIDSLIAASAEAGDRIDGLVGVASRELAPIAAAGQRVGPWELVREIGRGGMGAVFLAHRVDGEYEARAAIKLIGGMRTPEHLRRFRAERQILAGLDHPNIARLLDGGSTDEGVPWVAMELVEGMPLDRYCDQVGLTVEQRIALFLDVCSAVAFAHSHLVVHRDIKPGNILVTAEGVPKLLDFGIAKLLDPEAVGMAETRTAMRLLTPAYGSPEQLRGEPVTIAADVYALGIVLYRLLAGRMPYDLEEKSLTEIERQVCELDPPRPSTVASTPRLQRKLRGDLDTIVMTALRKEPAARYASVDRFTDDLKRHVTGLPVLARGEHWAYRARKFARRHRAGVAVAAGLVILLTGFTGALGIQNQRLAAERDAATAARASAEQVASFLAEVFTVSDPDRARGDTVTARELLDAGAERVEAELAGQPALQAGMMLLIGRTYTGLGLEERARPLLEGALERYHALYGGVHPDVATTELDLAGVLQNLGDVAAAEPLYRQALATRRTLFGDEHPDVSDAYAKLGFLLETRGDFAGGEELFRVALDQDRRFFSPDHPRVAKALMRLGRLLRQNGRIEEAEPILREALTILRAHHGRDHPEVASAARNLAALLRDSDAYAEADTLYQEVIDIRRRVLGENHPSLGTALNSYALMLDRMGETDRAIDAFTAAVTLAEHNSGPAHRSVGAVLVNIGWTLIRAGRYDEALTHFQRAVEVWDHALDGGHPGRAAPRMGLATAYRMQGRCADAEPWLRQALAIRRRTSPAPRDLVQTLGDLGECLTLLDRYDEAAAALREAHAINVANDDPDDTQVTRTRERLIELARRSGRPELIPE